MGPFSYQDTSLCQADLKLASTGDTFMVLLMMTGSAPPFTLGLTASFKVTGLWLVTT